MDDDLAKLNTSLFPGLEGQVVLAGGTIEALQGELFPDEEAIIANAVEKRRREFRAGRTAARLALSRIMPEVLDSPILSGENRQPIWPRGVIGSITHTAFSAYAAVALPGPRLRALGIDAEERNRLKAELWSMVFRPAEMEWLGRASAERRQGLATIVFSAKESFYKAQFGLTGEWLGFQNAEVAVEGKRFEISLSAVPRQCEALGGSRFAGYHTELELGEGPMVMTAIVLAQAS